MKIKFLFRYDTSFCKLIDSRYIVLRKYEILRFTPKGYWIKYGDSKKWVSAHNIKRFAYPTKEQALESFKKRKTKQIEILEKHLVLAKNLLRAANNIS